VDENDEDEDDDGSAVSAAVTRASMRWRCVGRRWAKSEATEGASFTPTSPTPFDVAAVVLLGGGGGVG